MKKKMIPTKDRPTRPVTIRMPEDVLEDLKRVAPTRDLPGYQSLIKFYVRQGLRLDLERLWEMEERSKNERERVNRSDVEEALQKIGLDRKQTEVFWKEVG
ncbi:MAG: hypothetical protein V1792_00565 [Pseudomonadota bacterium]